MPVSVCVGSGALKMEEGDKWNKKNSHLAFIYVLRFTLKNMKELRKKSMGILTSKLKSVIVLELLPMANKIVKNDFNIILRNHAHTNSSIPWKK